MRSAVLFHAQGRHYNFLTRRMRYNQILASKIPKFCYRSKHKVSEKILVEVDDYGVGSISDRSKLIDKVSVMLGYSNLDELTTFDVSGTCKKFPSITVGSSPLLELYRDSHWHSEVKTYSPAVSTEEFQPILTDGKWMIPETLTKMSPSLNSELPDTSSSSKEASFSSSIQCRDGVEDQQSLESLVLDQQFQVSVSEDVPDQQPQVSVSEDSLPPIENDNLCRVVLDKPISLIEGVSKRHSRQLQDCDIHTMRKLLHHFPRTYADLQNSHTGLEDGQYLIFVGKILSARAVKVGFSLSIFEIIVHGEVDCKKNDEVEQGCKQGEAKKLIYLHMKNYFRGTRFTSQGFLRCLEKKHNEGEIVCVSGKVRATSKDGHYEMRDYSLDVINNEQDPSVPVKGRPHPIYPSKGGLKPQFFRDIITRALQSFPANIDPIPHDITTEIGLLRLRDAYVAIHQPKDLNDADLARKRFIFDEFFYLQLGRMYQMLEGLGSRIEKEGLLEKYKNVDQSPVNSEEWCDLTKSILEGLPFSLTKSQLRAVSEIIWDVKRPVPMNRLLQGDVGCGKTIVAFLACMEVIGSGYQAAYMVPTELLAVQHYEHLLNLLENLESACRPSIALLTGSTPAKHAQMIRNVFLDIQQNFDTSVMILATVLTSLLQELQAGTISLVIGTHSLIADSVEFLALRLAVIDEQHRFGVIQRGRLNSKLSCTSTMSETGLAGFGSTLKGEIQMAPHVLAVTATPIPRSLALALYGDMSLTQVTDLPPERLPIETCVVQGDDDGFKKVYEMMLQELEAGGKVYLVYPIIDQSEQLPQLRAASADFDSISAKFSNYRCGLLHGRMKGDAKDKALKCFRDGETQILLSTQVIETGIDVPDASMMVVMNADRFGMAQLHQLRGRVGRGARKSTCILVGSTGNSLTRLKVLGQSSDGFHLAKVDLLLRGPGDLLGKKQSGHLPEFPITRLDVDGSIIQDAHVAALKILSASHDLKQFPQLKAELSMRQPLSILGD